MRTPQVAPLTGMTPLGIKPMGQTTHDALSLSSGTIAGLIDNRNYAAIDKVQSEFVDFCEAHEGEFETWVLAWQAFDIERNPSQETYETEVEFIADGSIVHTPAGDQFTFAPQNAQLSLGF